MSNEISQTLSDSQEFKTTKRFESLLSQFTKITLLYFVVATLLSGLLKSVPLVSWFILYAILAVMFLSMQISVQNTRTVISPRGIEFYSLGYRIITTWENIEKIGSTPWTERYPFGDGLLLKEPAFQGIRWLANTTSLHDRFIPLGLYYDVNWQQSSIGEAIKKYRPDIFEISNEHESSIS